MNEWELQLWLDDMWTRDGIVLDHGERLFLVAREIMIPTWKINRATGVWNLPSIDFLALDVSARLVAIELKVRITAPSSAWAALFQVSHRAVELSRSFTPLRLEDVWRASSPGGIDATFTGTNAGVLEEHRRFFALRAQRSVQATARRVIAATEFGAGVWPALDEFNSRPLPDLLDQIDARYRGRLVRKESGRLRASMRGRAEFATSVETLLVPMPSSSVLPCRS